MPLAPDPDHDPVPEEGDDEDEGTVAGPGAPVDDRGGASRSDASRAADRDAPAAGMAEGSEHLDDLPEPSEPA